MSANRDALFRAVERWNAADLDGYLELYDDSIQLHGYSEQPLDKTEVRAFYEGIFASLSDIKLEIHQVIESKDDDHLAARATMTGVHTGDLNSIPPTGKTIAQPVMTMLKFRDGKVVERWSVADMLAVLAQIGALPG